MHNIMYRDRNEGKHFNDGRPKPPNWAYRFESASIRGKRQFIEKCGFATKDEAIAAGIRAFQQYNSSGSVFEQTNMSYSDCLDSWLENYVPLKCLQQTKEHYEASLNLHVRPILGKYRLISIHREQIQNLINDMFKRRFSRNSLVNLLGLLNSSFRYAKRQGWIETNPAEDIDLPSSRQCINNRKKVREPVPRYVIDQILRRFPEGHPEHIGIMLAYHCGLRLGEAYGLFWDDINLDQGIIYVQHQVQWSRTAGHYIIVPPKYDSCRRIKLDNVMWEYLKREKERQEQGRIRAGEGYLQLYIDEYDQLNEDQHGKPVFMVNTRPNGTYITKCVMHHASEVIRTEIGYAKFDFHSLRHTHATELCEAGVNIKEIQRRLGHSTMELTSKRYLHATDMMEDQSVGLMNDMFGCPDQQPVDSTLRILQFVK